MEEGENAHNTFVQMFNLELKKKNVQDVEVTKDTYKQVLAHETAKTKALQDELKKIEEENKDLSKLIQNYKLDIEKNKLDYTSLIYGLRNELKLESNKLEALNDRNNKLDEIHAQYKERLEKIKFNIDEEIRKRKNVERKLEAKTIERVTSANQLELLRNEQTTLQAEIKEINEKIDEIKNITSMLEEKYKNSVNFGRSLTKEYKELESQNELNSKEQECLVKLIKCHESTNSQLAQMIIENINPCEDKVLLNELCEMMSNIDKENNRHQHTMEQIKYEREMHGKMMRDHGKRYQNMNFDSLVDEKGNL